MKHLDPDSAVRGFIEDAIEALDIPTPKGDTMSIDVLTEFPRDVSKIKRTAVFVEPGLVTGDDYLGDDDGEPVDDTENEYEDGTVLMSCGPATVGWRLIGYSPSKDMRDLLLRACRNIFRGSSKETDAFEDYYDRPVKIMATSYRRNETPEDASAHLWTFEINGTGETEDVYLADANTHLALFRSEGTVEDYDA